MRSRISLYALLFVVGSLAFPLAAHAGGIPFFGPIIPEAYNVCPASWALLITVINNIISLLITLAIIFVAPLMIAYSGFLFVVNPVNASGKEQAKKILTNTIVGIVIALAAWMIVDAVMAVLYNQNAQVPGTAATLGVWSSLISGNPNDMCLPQAGALPNAGLNQTPVTGVTATGSTVLSLGTGACSASTLQQYASNLTISQANTLACLAKPESACGSKMQNYSWNKATSNGKASTAYGAFQITLSGNHSSFENQACYTAAGVSGPLNCQKGFGANGFTAGGDPTVLANCVKAASNLSCNTAAAVDVLQKQGFGAWTSDPNSSAQRQCIAQYAGG